MNEGSAEKIPTLLPVILAGGIGNRLWPLSTPALPKQFLALLSKDTLLQETIMRLDGLPGLMAPIVVCNEQHCGLVVEQLKQIDKAAQIVICESVGRNTAPAIAVAALSVKEIDDPLLLVLPADHVLRDIRKFQLAVQKALTYARDGALVTFGVKPTRPEIGYGYIKSGTRTKDDDIFHIDQFVEKPDLLKAKSYLDAGNYYWNSGIFLFRASSFLKELAEYEPEILSAAEKSWKKARKENSFCFLPEAEFAACPKKSIDYAVMEKTRDGMMVVLDAGWSDVGSWQSLEQELKKASLDSLSQYFNIKVVK